MNILLCSAGRRTKLVSYFKQELYKMGGKIAAVDCDSTAPALQMADIAEIVPRFTDPNYIQHLIQLCKKYDIKAVLSLIDPELSLLAEHKAEFENENIKVIVSNKEVIKICFDKFLTYQFLLEHGLPAVPTYVELNELLLDLENNRLRFPLIIKPRMGSASIGISMVHSMNELLASWIDTGEMIAQPFIKGNEYGIDSYVDLLNFQATAIFCKRKIRMRAGETDKSVSVNDSGLLHLMERLINVLGPIGPIDIDCFKTDEGYVISEINPRFGGGYPHAHEAGQNFVTNIINNLVGKTNKADIGNYSEGSVMIKFDDVMLLNSHSLNKITL